MTDFTWLNGKLIAVDGVTFPDLMKTTRPPRWTLFGWHCYGDVGMITDLHKSQDMPRIPVHSSAPVAFWAEAVCRAALITGRAGP